MDKELKGRLIAVLEEGTKGQITHISEIKGVLSLDEYMKCFYLLNDGGYITFSEGYGHHTSLSGREHLYRLKHPVRSWFKGNWFPFVVAITTVAVAMTGIVVQIVG